jgi:hypothetical protein
MLSDKKYGLSVNMMATRVMPSLIPQTVNPSLNLEQFMILLEVSKYFHIKVNQETVNKKKKKSVFFFCCCLTENCVNERKYSYLGR